MKKQVLSAIAAIVLMASGAQAFGLPGGLGASKSSSVSLSENDIDAVFVAVKNAEYFLGESSLKLVNVLGSSESKAKLEAEMKNAESIKDPKEKSAKIAKIQQDAVAEAIKNTESKEGKEKLKNLDTKQKQDVGSAIGNFALAGLLDAVAVKMGSDVVSSASKDPMGAAVKFASKLPSIKDIVATLPKQATDIATMTDSLVKIAKSGNVPLSMPDDKKVEEVKKTKR